MTADRTAPEPDASDSDPAADTSGPDPTEDAPAASAAPRRRWRRRVLIGLCVALVLVLAGVGGVGWYFSGEVVDVRHGTPEFTVDVYAVDTDTVTLARTADTERAGTWGLQWKDGRAVLGEVTAVDGDRVTRAVDEVLYGKLTAGSTARIDMWTYGENPRQAYGLDYESVDIPTELGPAPAWFVPGDGDTWVIGVHGHNASPGEALRIIPALHAAGYPVLSVTHRNDVGAPDSPDGLHHLGDTEWRDVQSAVDYAMEHGAGQVVLYGWSMGGAVVTTTLRRMDDPGRVAGIVLDSPVLDWTSTLEMQGEDRGVPGPVVTAAEWIVEWRADLDLSDLDQRPFAAQMDTPLLLFADRADETVDVTATLDFADRVDPALLTLVTTASGHTSSWNADPAAYESTVTGFLDDVR